jgi:hypothetical protein
MVVCLQGPIGIVGLIRALEKGCGGKLAQGGVLTLLLTRFLTLVTAFFNIGDCPERCKFLFLATNK